MSYPHLFTTPGLGAIAAEIDAERARQDAKGHQDYPDGTGSPEQRQVALLAHQLRQEEFGVGCGAWSDVLTAAVAEVNGEDDPAALRARLVRAAAVACAWIAAIDRRPVVAPDREPCGESGCLCYGIGPAHDDCACGCDCPRGNDSQPITT